MNQKSTDTGKEVEIAHTDMATWRKKDKKVCPREDSSLRLHGIAGMPQRDDLTTNRQGPKASEPSGLMVRRSISA